MSDSAGRKAHLSVLSGWPCRPHHGIVDGFGRVKPRMGKPHRRHGFHGISHPLSFDALLSRPLLFSRRRPGQDSQGWVQGLHSRARLLSGDRKGGEWLAGIEIALDPGFKTYWRNPGESGLPPRFDWSGSENVKSVDIRWPAPRVRRMRPAFPTCITTPCFCRSWSSRQDPKAGQARAECRIRHLQGYLHSGARPTGTRPWNAPVEPSRDRDRPADEGPAATGHRRCAANWRSGLRGRSPDEKRFTALLSAPAGTTPQLFVEAPDGWYFSTAAADDQQPRCGHAGREAGRPRTFPFPSP